MNTKNLKYIISGCPCSGTGYVAQSLSARGAQCGHEGYHWDHSKKTIVARGGGAGPVIDSSHIVALRLDDPSLAHTKVIHLVRNPLRVLMSLMCIRHPKNPLALDPEEVIRHLLRLNYAVENCPRTFYRHKVEGPIEPLLKQINLAFSPSDREISKTYNQHNSKGYKIDWEEVLPCPSGEEFRRMYQRYGYA